jgi:aryl-alcohol dehydrogenase-like predicted oxidoreductase
MNYRSLGRTGVQVSPLCLGCMNFGWKTSAEDSHAIIAHALDAGINFFDTANVYGRGASEEITGDALKRSGKRDRIILATKVHGPMDDADPNAWGNTRRHIIAQCEASLRRLQTDYIDLYQLHRPHVSVPIDEALRAMDDLIRAGKVRYIGTSTFAAWQVVESLWVSEKLGLNRIICEQPPYHLLDRRIERELLPMAHTFGIGIIPWSPMAGGLLSGKYSRSAEVSPEWRYADKAPRFSNQIHPGVFDAVEKFGTLAAEKSCALSQFSLAWVIRNPDVSSAIIGPRTLDQLTDNLHGLDVRISEEDCRRIDEIVAPGLMVSAFYDANFGPHPHRV